MESPFPKELTIQQVHTHTHTLTCKAFCCKPLYSYYFASVFQAFSDYQIQQMTANFVDQFGFNDEEFTDHDDSIG